MKWPEVEFEMLHGEPSRNGIYKSKEFHGTGTCMVNMGELFVFDRIGDQDMERIQLSEVEFEKNFLIDGDLLFGRRSLIESGAGKCSIVHKLRKPMVFESSLIRIRLNKRLANPEFYFYYFKSPQGRSRINAIVSGATVKGIRGSDLKKILVHLPPLPVQSGIAFILSTYDDLITLNQRRIQLLEESARLLYREWFVKLRFPGHESVAVRDGLPEGWQVTRLARVADVNRAFLGSKDKPESILYVDISTVTPGEIGEYREYSFDDAPGRARRKVAHGDIIWSCVRPNRRSYALIWEPDERLIVSTGFAVLTAITLPFSYLYLATTTDEFIGYLEKHATGAAYPAVTGKDFENAPILLPNKETLNQFDGLVLPIFGQAEILKRQNKELRQARDLLLPKLMSGALDVSRIALPEEIIL